MHCRDILYRYNRATIKLKTHPIIILSSVAHADPAKTGYSGSCSGDSGGPLVRMGSTAATDVQHGLVSGGTDCQLPLTPGKEEDMFTNVAFYNNNGWIKQSIAMLTGAGECASTFVALPRRECCPSLIRAACL